MDVGSDLLTVVSCDLPAEQVDCLFELLDADLFTPTSWYDMERGTSRVDVFLEDSQQAPAVCKALTDAAELLGFTLELKVSQLVRSDWAEGWKRFFKTEKVSDRIVVRPSWEKYMPQGDERVLTLDPGMSFGTGKHETTRGCLRFLDRLAREDVLRAVTDMGCGTGILAIGAKLLGFSDVRAFDNDPDCIQVTRENAEINGVEIPVVVDDLSHPHLQTEIVVANILAPILITFVDQVAASVAPGGQLILSGILETQFADVRSAYEKRGMTLLDTILLGEWRTGLFAAEK